MIIKNKSEAQLADFILADNIYFNDGNYINVSIYDLLQRSAPEAQLAEHSPDKRGLSGHSGSIPGWGASALIFFLNKPSFLKI